MGILLQDIRYGIRTLLRNPGFTAVALLTLALGIGANSAIFSVVNAVLLRPLPYPDPERLVLVWERNTSIGKERDPAAPANFLDWQKQNTEFEELAAYRYGGFTLTGDDFPEQVGTLGVSSNLFRTLGAEAAAGRTFTEEEAQKQDRVVVLSHSYWQRRHGGDRSLVGKAITLNGSPYTVVGVMPADFAFPDGASPIETYSPLTFFPGELVGRRTHTLSVVGRLKPGSTIAAAHDNLSAIAKAIAAQDATSNPEVTIAGAHDNMVRDVRLGLLVLLGTVGFVLMIACVNVANLLLARSAARRRELAIRTSLGAGRWRVGRQLLTESLLLATAGGAAGIFIAWRSLDLFVRFSPPDLPRMNQVSIDFNVLLFAAIVSLLTGVLFGAAPALMASRSNLGDTIKETSLTVSGSVRRNAGRSLLVVAEIGLSLMLVAGAGLMIRTLVNLDKLEHGFRPEQVLTMQVFLPNARYPVDNAQFRPLAPGAPPAAMSKPSAFFAELLDRIEKLPGVQSAGAVSALPLNPVAIDFDMPVVIEGRPRPKPGEEPQADFRIASEGYLQTMGIRLLRGRDFTQFDGPAGAPVMIVNEAMARNLFAGDEALGKRVILYGRAREIIGVAESVRHRGFSQEARPEMLVPSRQFQLGGMTLVVRSPVNRTALSESIRKEVLAMDPLQPAYRDRTMEEFVAESQARPTFTALLVAAFAVLAIVLALVGIYGVMSISVAQRTHEIGIRVALGAGRSDVVQMVLRHGATLTVLGVAVGLAGAAGLTRLMSGLLFGVSSTDPLTFIAAGAILAAAALFATYLPARRATRVDPIVALRYE